MNPTPPKVRRFPLNKWREAYENQPFSAEEQALIDDNRRMTADQLALINAIGSALNTWLAARPHVTREDVQAALEMGSTVRQCLRDHPNVTRTDIEVVLAVVPDLLADPDEDIAVNVGLRAVDTVSPSPLDLVIVAHHEAAHAVVQYRVAGFSGDCVTIIPNPNNRALAFASDGLGNGENRDHMEARILACYAGGHAQRRCDPSTADLGCDEDDECADDLLQRWGWTSREQEFRDRSRDLVTRHWAEIVVVAAELLKMPTLDNYEVELIADAAAGTAEFEYGSLAADLAQYRLRRTPSGLTGGQDGA